LLNALAKLKGKAKDAIPRHLINNNNGVHLAELFAITGR
jgi:hypothetical protein